MKTRILGLLAVGLVLIALGGCGGSVFLSEGVFFHVEHDGARMPVWVKGNAQSDVMIVVVHGGPGEDSGMGFTISQGFQYLENDYLFAYWDQRFTSMTQGHYDISTLNPDQFIEDTEKIVEVIRDLYPDKTLFMLGHSWGGQLSAGYLGRDNHASMFAGWIDLDGSIYGELEAQLMKQWILERVPAKLAEPGADVEFWQFIVDWYEQNPAPGNYSDYEPYYYVSALRGDAVDWEAVEAENPTPYVELIFKSMFSMSFYNNSFRGEEIMRQWDELNFTPELANITIPALMLWGADDGIVPAGVADYVYDNLGTDPASKLVVKIPECAHGPHHEQPETFYQEVRNFIETYK
jgi:pimeloyl-ACP methyl ester carboxylesterase